MIISKGLDNLAKAIKNMDPDELSLRLSKSKLTDKQKGQFRKIEALVLNYGRPSMALWCKLLPHIWGSKKFNHFDDAPRFEEFGATQRQFYRECKLCKRMEFMRLDAMGFLWWEGKDHWLFPYNSSYPPSKF